MHPGVDTYPSPGRHPIDVASRRALPRRWRTGADHDSASNQLERDESPDPFTTSAPVRVLSAVGLDYLVLSGGERSSADGR
jgi:hypothetical protein